MKHARRAAASIVALLASSGFAVLLFLLNHGATILLASGPDRLVSDRAAKTNITPVAKHTVLARLRG
jgi:hypothetical protein